MPINPIQPNSPIRADHFIKASEADSNPANNEGYVPKLESNGEISSVFTRFNYGGGADGAIVLDGTNTYGFLSKSGNVYTMTRNIFCTNITINSGCTLKTDGFLYFWTGKIDGSGKITWGVPNAGGNASGNTGGVGGAASGTGPIKNKAGGNGGRGGYPGVTGQGQAGLPGGSSTSSPGRPGAAGATGSGAMPGVAGPGGTASTYLPFGVFAFLSMIACDLTSSAGLAFLTGSAASGGGSGGGRTDGSNDFGGGGGGAASGGGCLGWGNEWGGTLTIENLGANGGNAATLNGETGGAGAGSPGGWSAIFFKKKTGTITYNLAGGNPGTGNGTPGTAATGYSYEIDISTLIR
ncbi:MAG TPA: hypothetical protein VGE62_01120 [Candidatus Paceibacterota bacterium]